ncbi:MAG: DNA polymerase III subunit gamma/tau [Thiotrichales bacterium]|nr:DNA polymerase III subunit gamma/tau [Thiotrichales bacterium]
MSYTVLARKWRPKNFAELVGQAHVMQALSNALDSNRLHHAYLFTGTRGVGKTTIARIFSKALNCQEGISSTPCGVCDTCRAIDEGRFIDLIEVDAASRTKVDDTREILDNVQFAPTQGRYKVYLIDEVHMLSKSSFNALLKTLEEPPEHVKFLLATTDPHKLPSTVLSRCLQFNLMRLTQTQIQGHLAHILEQETLPFESSALALIAKSADGSARDALSLLDQAIAYGAGEIRFEQVQTMLGLVDQQFTVAILQALADESPQQIKEIVQQLAAMGVDYAALLAQLIETLHALSYSQVLGGVSDATLLPEEFISELSQQLSADRVQLLYQIALLSKQDMQLAPDIRIGFEMALMRMLAFQPEGSVTTTQSDDDLTDNAARPSALPSQASSSSQPMVADSEPQFAEPMLVDQDPQTVLSALSSARALMSKNKSQSKPALKSSSEPTPEPSQEPMPEQASQHGLSEDASNDYSTTQNAHGNMNSASSYDNHQSMLDDALPWDNDEPASMPVQNQQASDSQYGGHHQPVQNQPMPNNPPTQGSADMANDHLAQIKQRLKQPLGKPQTITANNLNVQPNPQPVETFAQPLSEKAEHEEAHSFEQSPRVETQATPQAMAKEEQANASHSDARLSHANSQSTHRVSAAQMMANAQPTQSHDDQSVPVVDVNQALQQDAPASSMASASQLIEINYAELNEQNRLPVWLEVLESLQPEGMAAELTRQSVLVAYSPQHWQLSVDPEQAYAKTDMAVLRLTEALQQRLGHEVQLSFVTFNEHNTPAKHEQLLAIEKQNQAEVSIQNDPVVNSFINELGMEVIPNSISPVN